MNKTAPSPADSSATAIGKPAGCDANTPSRISVILVGNYGNDYQESMQRFSKVLFQGLKERGLEVSLVSPQPFFGRLKASASGIGKWLGYIDKFILFPFQLRCAIGVASSDRNTGKKNVVVHICDHSNAMYSRHVKSAPLAITCHDLLAIRGALGEETDCPASSTGKILQRWILSGLSGATALICVSSATRSDVERLVPDSKSKARLVLMGLNHHFKVLPEASREKLLTQVPALPRPYLLMVGSNALRKNREGALRIFQKVSTRWNGALVFAGQPLTPELRQMARELGIDARIHEIEKPGDDLLEALYNGALALLFPSTFEGFGWPIIEAQACGCPVVCSASGPLPEVAGESDLIQEVEDEEGFASAILRLTNPELRELAVQHGLVNIQRFQMARMIDQYIEIYRELAGG